MPQRAKWKNFTKEQIFELAYSSINREEWFIKMGYVSYDTTTARNIIKEYPDLILPQKNCNSRVKWKQKTKEELCELARGCTSQVEFMQKLGYTTCRPDVYREIVLMYPEIKDIMHTHYDVLWEKFSYEELQKIADESNSETEFCKKIGYKDRSSYVMKQIYKKYPNITIVKGDNICKWKRFSKEELQNMANESEGLTDFYNKMGYATESKSGKSDIKEAILKVYPDFIMPEKTSISLGELKIKNILQENNTPFKEQIKMDELRGKTLALSFDFAILNEIGNVICLIEYQGEQHFHPINFFGGYEKYQKQCEYDNLKRQYCLNNHIKLIEIPYTDYSKIDYNYLKERIYGSNN